MEKAMHREEVRCQPMQIERSFEQERKIEQLNSHLSRNLKKELAIGVTTKHADLLQSKQKWYQEIKKMSETNRSKINRFKEKQLKNNQINTKRVRLMEIHGKENVKSYWKERVEIIHKDRDRENEKNSHLFESSMQNISFLEQREEKMLREIREAMDFKTNGAGLILQE